MSVIHRSGTVAFRPRARLLKLIGAELISDEVVALMELVKNAYDADASRVTVTFTDVLSPGGTITVGDDGTGMDLETVVGVWMEPGATSKAGGVRSLGRRRRLLGEKGVGRFAADKLGAHLELISRRGGESVEVRATFDWDRFDTTTEVLADVRNRWEIRPAAIIDRRGTVLRITRLRTAWTERMFRRLATRLGRLCSPFQELDDFTIRLESSDFPRYSGELRPDFLRRAPYRIEASWNGESVVEIRLNEQRVTRQVWSGLRPLTCGPVRARIFAFDLETEALARIGPRLEVRAWLREWSGISVYRDGFRIWPYGEPHDDWLRLDQRRVNNPVVRLSNNQVVGFVEIARDRNPELRDQTNREGLIHNQAFDDLRTLIHFLLEVLEEARQAIRHPRNGQHGTAPSRNGHNMSGQVAAANGVTAVGIADRRQLERWSELAAAGQAGAILVRALAPVIEDLRDHVAQLSGMLDGNGSAPARRLLGELDDLAGWLADRVQVLVANHPEIVQRRRSIDVGAELESVQLLLEPLLAITGSRMEASVRGTSLLRVEMRPETFRHLVCILAGNSLRWAGQHGARIRVVARPRGDSCELVVADNGPGIPARVAARLFEPFFSTGESGRGMGLAIARSIVELHRGRISVVTDGRRRGAALRVLLPRKHSRSTTTGR